jgi:hypothetical protein
MRARSEGSGPFRLILVAILAVCVSGTAAMAADSPTTTAPPPGTGPQPKGLGLGSTAAMAQETCNPNGRTSFNLVGNGPYCVNPWPESKDNGGATAPGVTATAINVVVYAPNDQMFSASSAETPPMNLATGGRASVADVVKDWQAAYDYGIEHYGTHQMWGRRPDIEVVTATGPDEAAQRADAVEVIDKKPFMVFDMTRPSTGGAPVFSAAVADHKIVVFSPSTTSRIGAQQSPYRFSWNSDPESSTVLAAAFVGRSLAGRKAQWAGDDHFTSKVRTFGVIHPTTGFDIAQYAKYLKQNGGGASAGQDLSYDPADAQQLPEQAQTMVSKLKTSGVTSVVLFADSGLLGPLLKAATAQDYHPEWIFTGFQFHDFDGFGRTFDQDQMKHAFGLSNLSPWTQAPSLAYLSWSIWYWGTTQGSTWAIAGGLFGYMYAAITFAGPNLTAENVKKGLFARPASGGAADGTTAFEDGFGKTTGMPYDEYAPLGADRALVWWSSDTTGPSNAIGVEGKGLFMYLDAGKRYGYKGFPKTLPKFFDKTRSTAEVPYSSAFVGNVTPELTACTGCPSEGGTG